MLKVLRNVSSFQELYEWLEKLGLNKSVIPPVSQTRFKPSPRLKCKSELFQLK